MASNLRVDTILPSTGTTLGIGTAGGSVTFLGDTNITTSGALTAGSASITGNLGIGGTLTYEDVTNIDSVGIITARSTVSIADSIVHTGDTNTSLRFPAADTITAETGGSERIRIDSTGRVLIGTTNADSVGSIDQNVVIGSTTNAEEVALTLNVMEGTNNRRIKLFLDDDDGVFGLDSTASTGVPDFVVRSVTSEKFRINSAGSMGLGTGANIDERVHFENAGNISLLVECSTSGGGSNSAIRLKSADSSSDWYMQTGNAVSGGLRFYSGDEKMRITSQGYVTKPYNVLFHAEGGPNTVSSANIVFSSAIYNVGTGYNTSTGKFTPPIAGYYAFYFQVYRNDDQSDANASFMYTPSGGSESQQSEARARSAGAAGYTVLNSHMIHYMNLNDTMHVKAGTPTIHCNSSLSYFEGFLLG